MREVSVAREKWLLPWGHAQLLDRDRIVAPAIEPLSTTHADPAL